MITKLERLEQRLAVVNEKIWELELADRLVGNERKEWYIRRAEKRHLLQEIAELKEKEAIA